MKCIYETGDILENKENDRAIVLNYGGMSSNDNIPNYAVLIMKKKSGESYITCFSLAGLKELYPEYIGRDFSYVCKMEDAAAEHFKLYRK